MLQMRKHQHSSLRTGKLPSCVGVQVDIVSESAKGPSVLLLGLGPETRSRLVDKALDDSRGPQRDVGLVKISAILICSFLARPEKGCTGDAGVSRSMLLFSRRRVAPFLSASYDIGRRRDKGCAGIFIRCQGRFASCPLAWSSLCLRSSFWHSLRALVLGTL
jgi:hypothetical protein